MLEISIILNHSPFFRFQQILKEREQKPKPRKARTICSLFFFFFHVISSTVNHFDDDEQKMTTTDMTESFSDKPQPPLIYVNSRRVKNLLHYGETTTSVYDSLLAQAESKSDVLVGEDCGVEDSKVGKLLLKKKKMGNLGIGELVKLCVDKNVLSKMDRPRLRDFWSYTANNGISLKRKGRNSSKNCDKLLSGSSATKR